MNVLFLLLNFPDLNRDNNLYGDLALEFIDKGHRVYVATLLESRNRTQTYQTDIRNIRVLHVRSADLFNVGFIKKGLGLIVLQWNFLRAIRKYWSELNIELVIYPTPPISFLKVIRWLKKRYNCRTYLILRDIFPQNAIDIGVLSRGPLYAYFRRMEKRLYAVSDHIGCMSPKNIDYIVGHNSTKPAKVGLLPNWRKIRDDADLEGRDFRSELGVKAGIVAVFGGVIGVAQELEFLIELAKSLSKNTGITFLVIGDGNRRSKIEQIVRKNDLKNVILRRRIPSDEFATLLRQCDIGLINLNRRFTIPNFPSKVLDYFEARLPVLAALDSATDFGRLLDESGAGLHCLTGDLEAYRKNFEKLVSDPALRAQMGACGRKYLETHLTVDRAYLTIAGSLGGL